MSATDYLEGQIGNHIFRTDSFTKPSGIYVGLYTSTPSEAGGGSEVSGAGYARVLHGPNDTSWAGPTGGNGLFTNDTSVTFPAPTADWGTVSAFAIHDASSGGNMLLYGLVSPAKPVFNGDAAPVFDPQELQITIS